MNPHPGFVGQVNRSGATVLHPSLLWLTVGVQVQVDEEERIYRRPVKVSDHPTALLPAHQAKKRSHHWNKNGPLSSLFFNSLNFHFITAGSTSGTDAPPPLVERQLSAYRYY